MKGFLKKSFKNNREQVHFYRHFRPVNHALTKIFQGFSRHIVTSTFQSHSKQLLLKPAAQL